MRAGGGIGEGEDNGSIPNHAGRAGNILSLSIVDVLQSQLSVLYARWVRVVIIGKADVISVDILEVVADNDMSREQIDFTIQAILASPLDVQLGSCVCIPDVQNMIYGNTVQGIGMYVDDSLSVRVYRVPAHALRSYAYRQITCSLIEHKVLPCGPGAPGGPGGPTSPFWPGVPLVPSVPG